MTDSDLLLNTRDFDHLSAELKSAARGFQEDPTPENFARIITALRAFGVSGGDLWRRAAAYTRAHPVQMALLAGVLFYAVKGLLGDRPRRLAAELH